MTPAELSEALHTLETKDPRRDLRHLAHAVWIWERDQLFKEHAGFDPHQQLKSLARPPLGENSLKALEKLGESVQRLELMIAVELTEKGYTVERWPEYWSQGRIWNCVVSMNGGRLTPVRVRVSHGSRTYDGLPVLS